MPNALITLLLLGFYFLVDSGWLQVVFRSGAVVSYVVQPLIWVAVAIIALRLRKVVRQSLAFSRSDALSAAVVGLFQVSVLVNAGLILGFGNSPYSHDIAVLPLNAIVLGSSLIGMELARWIVVQGRSRAWRAVRLVAVSVLFTFISAPLNQLTGLGAPERTVHVIGTRVIPELGEQLLATYMTIIAGPVAAMAFRGVLGAFEWFSPALPNLSGILSAFIYGLLTYVGFRVFRGLTRSSASRGGSACSPRRSLRQRTARYGWPVTTALSVALIWFFLGLFPYRPTIIAGNSMSPGIHRGDLAIIGAVDPLTLRAGDIIEYRVGTVAIVHRVINVSAEDGTLAFITRGDANDTQDPEPVSPSQVTGELKFNIPRVGWFGVRIKQLIGELSKWL